MDSFLQIFLVVNVFLVGAAAAIAALHAHAHFKPPQPEKPKAAEGGHLPPEVKARLVAAAEASFQKVLDHSVAQLQRDLDTTTTQLNKQLEKLGGEVIASETDRYRQDLEHIRQQLDTTFTTAQTEIAQHQTELKAKIVDRHAELEAKMTDEITEEKQRLIRQIDAKLADAVMSFLAETLQHNVDLGAQSAYLTAMLDEHKDELAKGVADEA